MNIIIRKKMITQRINFIDVERCLNLFLTYKNSQNNIYNVNFVLLLMVFILKYFI